MKRGGDKTHPCLRPTPTQKDMHTDRQTDRHTYLFVKTKTKIRKAIQTRQYQITIINLVGKKNLTGDRVRTD